MFNKKIKIAKVPSFIKKVGLLMDVAARRQTQKKPCGIKVVDCMVALILSTSSRSMLVKILPEVVQPHLNLGTATTG
jgi:nitrate/nitrite-specific signal transduction histidine kinase